MNTWTIVDVVSLLKIRYVWNGRKTYSSFRYVYRVHRELTNERSFLSIHSSTSSGLLPQSFPRVSNGRQNRVLLVVWQFWLIYYASFPVNSEVG